MPSLLLLAALTGCWRKGLLLHQRLTVFFACDKMALFVGNSSFCGGLGMKNLRPGARFA